MPEEDQFFYVEHASEDDDLTNAERIHFRAHALRLCAKDILLNVVAAPALFPNRIEIMRLANQILDLVPVHHPTHDSAGEANRK